MQYIHIVYESIKKYFTRFPPHNYIMPYNTQEIEPLEEFERFKRDRCSINKVIFAMNNIPDVIHNLLFSQRYYHITIKLQLGQPELTHNLDMIYEDFDDDEITHTYIRINIIIPDNPMQHVNCVIIDRSKKYMLIFEPQVEFKYNVILIYELLSKYIDTKYYRFLLPVDIGYNGDNKLQGYDAYCQSYVILAYMLAIVNKSVQPSEFSKMFNMLITFRNIGYLLFYINILLNQHNYDIGTPQEIWTFPSNKLETIINLIGYYYNGKKEANIGTPYNYTVRRDDDDGSVEVVDNI